MYSAAHTKLIHTIKIYLIFNLLFNLPAAVTAAVAAAVAVEVQYPFVHIVTEPAKYSPAGQLITREHLCVHGVLFVMNPDILIIIRLVLPAMAVAENSENTKGCTSVL
jgi:hypothetical protein